VAATLQAQAHGSPHDGPRRSFYFRTPLYIKIMAGMILGVILGYAWKYLLIPKMGFPPVEVLKPWGNLVLQLLRLLATPLIFIAVVNAIMKAKSGSTKPGKLAWLLLSNTTVAILIGLAVANTLRPGTHAHLLQKPATEPASQLASPVAAPAVTTIVAPPATLPHATTLPDKPFDPVGQLLSKIPSNLIDGFQQNEIISIIMIAIALGIALRIVRTRQQKAGEMTAGMRIIEGLLDIAFDVVMVMLHWLFELVPYAVFIVVTRTVADNGITPLVSMAFFVIAVLLAF